MHCSPASSSTLDTLAIQRALDAAKGKGGVVVVPEGTYLTKQVQLRSDTMLWLDKNAVLLASQNYATYPHVLPCESLVAVRNTGRALVYAERARNISISGGGELNANGRCRFKVNDPKGINKLYTSRPDNLYTACCEDIRVSDVRFTSAAYWTLVPLSSRFVTLEHLMLDCMNTPNRDGIDPVDCHDLSVRHCCIMAGDDGFCLKTADRMGCRNILAEDLVIQSLASAIKIGTDSYAKVENVTVRRCILKNVNRCGIAVETVDGAAIRNCTFEDIDMTDCGGPMYMTIGHRNRKALQFPVRVGSMAHIVFRRIGYRAPYLFSRCKTVYEACSSATARRTKFAMCWWRTAICCCRADAGTAWMRRSPSGRSTRSTTGMGCPPGRRSHFASARMCALRTMSFRRKGRMCVRW